MKPSAQCSQSAKRANLVLGQILNIRDKITFISLNKRYVGCHLEFAGPVWSPWTKQDKDVLEKVQKRAVQADRDHMKTS